MKIVLTILGILALSFLAAIGSFKYERTHPSVTGNVCDASVNNPRGLCYENLPVGGFPFSYLFDIGGVTGQGHLEIFDDFKTEWFIADVVFYAMFFSLTGLLIRKKIYSPTALNTREL